MTAYLKIPARPTGLATDLANLRSLAIDNVLPGMSVLMTDISALAFWTYRWDPDETTADDGARFVKPNSVDPGDPGRWVASGATDALPNTYVLRDSSGLSAVVPVAPLTLTVDNASPSTTTTILTLRRTTSDAGHGQAGIGSRLAFEAEDSAGTPAIAAQIIGSLTVATSGSVTGKLGFSLSSAGFFGEVASINGAGEIRATVKLLAPKVDVATAGLFAIAPDIATSITLGKAAVHTTSAGNLTAANLLTDGALDRSTAGPGTLWPATASSGAIGKSSAFDLLVQGVSVTIKGYKPTGDASGALSVWSASGTQTAGYLLDWGDGGSFTRAGGIAFDGVAEVCIGRPTGIKSADYGAKFWDIVECSPPALGMTVTLPNPTGHFGKPVWVKINGTTVNNVTITTPSGSIDDAGSKVITGAWPAVMLISYGGNGFYAFPHL